MIIVGMLYFSHVLLLLLLLLLFILKDSHVLLSLKTCATLFFFKKHVPFHD